MAELPASAPKPGQALLIGRIDNVERVNGSHFTRIVLPAADAYVPPAVVVVQSETKIGNVGEDVKILVAVGGYINNWKNAQGDTVKSARVTLKAL